MLNVPCLVNSKLLTTFSSTMGIRHTSQQLPLQSPATSPPCTSSGPPIGAPGRRLSPSDLGLTDEDWQEFSDPTREEWDRGSGSDVEITPNLPAPMTGRVLVEGVFEPDPFTAAHVRNLHSTPQLSQSGKKEAYVVFVGRQPGVYQTWYDRLPSSISFKLR